MFFFKLPNIFRKKPVVRQEKLDPMAEDTLKVEHATLVLASIAAKYGVAGMKEMSQYIGNKIGNEIVNTGLRRWEI